MPGGSRQRTLQFLSHPLPRRFPLQSYLWQYSIRTSLLQMRSLSLHHNWNLLSNICLRNSSVHESVISILRANSIVDRDTFVNMYDSESSLKEGAADQGFDLTTGGLPHKREFARIVTAWENSQGHGLRPNSRQTLLRKHMVFR